MDSAVEVESEVRSDVVDVKRPPENGEFSEEPQPKKARVVLEPVENSSSCVDVSGGFVGDKGNCLKKVAEVVLVLAAMGKMRGGRVPTQAEKEMMAEAREKLVNICEGFAPKDVFPRDAFGSVIEDLGLNKLKEQRLGFRPPKISIAEKLLLSKRKMEKSEEFSLPSATYQTQRVQANAGTTVENRGLSHSVRAFPSEKQNHAPMSSGNLQPATPTGPVAAVNSASLPYQLPTSEVRPMINPGLPSGHPTKDPSPMALPRVDRPYVRLEGRPNGSYTSQVQANTPGDHVISKTATWSVHPQSVLTARIGPDSRMSSQSTAKIEGNDATPAVGLQATTSKPFISQTLPGNAPNILQQSQGMNFSSAPPLRNTHAEIGKIIQKLLQPRSTERPTWTPPSRDYMNKALICQMCKAIITEVDGVLVCDACEKGYHLKCIQNTNQKGVPRGEWHCGKCLALSNGKPLPPKYGRVMRNISASKASPSPAATRASVNKSSGASAGKSNQQKIVANGNTTLQNVPSNYLASRTNVSTSMTKPPNSGSAEVHGNHTASSGGNVDANSSLSGACPNNFVRSSSGLPLSSSNTSVQGLCEGKVVELKPSPPEKSVTNATTSEISGAPGNPQDNNKGPLMSNKELPSKQSLDHRIPVKDLREPGGGETLNSNSNYETDQNKHVVLQVSPSETSGRTSMDTDQSGSSSDGLHNVDWRSHVVQLVDEKTHYRSCCINGIVHNIQDHVLIHFGNDKIVPSKLLAMWEDNRTRMKWVTVNRCYFPSDLPETVGRPCGLEDNEVYGSNRSITMLAGFIKGPCEVLPPNRFAEEIKRRTTEPKHQLRPLYLCKWIYDESKGLFRDSSC